MRLRIHRGAQEIGGNCVELESDGYSILVDLGLPLDAPEPTPSLLPDVAGLVDGSNPKLLGVVISHSHGDHYGLAGLVHPNVPVFVGAQARSILMASEPFLRLALTPAALQSYTSSLPFELGPFRITSFLTDHSAFDAHSLLVEADGQRVFYSGDLRAHGRKARLIQTLIANPPAAIDVLLLEGTTLTRPAGVGSKTERDLENEIVSRLRTAKGLVLSLFSPQNIDRFVTIFRATRRVGREFIGDVYLAHILRTLDLPSLPGPSDGSMRVYLPSRQRSRITSDRSFELLDGLASARIYPEEITATPKKWVMLFRASMRTDVDRLPPGTATDLIYSLWPGYLSRDDGVLQTWCQTVGIDMHVAHTSGHADPPTLQRIARALDAKRVIPMHTDAPKMMKDLIANVVTVSDGDWVCV